MRFVITIVLGASLACGCALTGARLPEEQATLVARDFVSALARLRGFSPQGTTVQLRPATTTFAESLELELRKAGFGMQGVPEDGEGPLLVTYEADRYDSDDAGESVGYRVRVGGVELGREYELRAGRVFPATALSVRGVEIDAAPLDGSIFDRRVPGGGPIVPVPLSDGEIDPARTETTRDSVTDAADARVAVESSAIAAPDGEVAALHSLGSGATSGATRNYLELGESNYAHLFEQLVVEEREVLVFPYDSMRLGVDNKRALARMIEGFDPETDVMSVIGCSHGKSSIPNGTQYLATGRANRVKEEFIYLGLDPSSVLEEGCWAGSDQQDLPARGVIVTRRTLDTSA